MTTLIKLWCEWDYGQDSVIFSDEEKAKDWFNKAILTQHEEDSWRADLNFEEAPADATPYSCLDDEGLVGMELITLDP